MIVRATHLLVAVCRTGVFIAMAVLIGAVLTQVVGRTIGNSPVWTEELTRFALIYVAALGTGVALLTGDLVNVDAFCDAMPGDAPRRLRMFASVAVALICFALIPGALRYVEIGALQRSPAMGASMEFVHLSVLVLLGLLGVFATLRFVLDWRRVDLRAFARDGGE